MTGRPETARALVLTAPRQIGFLDLEVPRPETNCALLRVEACGLCGTDHEMYTGHLPAAVPLVPGHETVGVSEEVGQAAAARWQVGVGDRVAIECFQSCRRCQPCRTGVYRRCEENGLGTAYGLSPLDTARLCPVAGPSTTGWAPTRCSCRYRRSWNRSTPPSSTR